MKGSTVIKQVSVYGLAGFGVFCLTILLLSQWLSDPLQYKIQSVLGLKCSWQNTDGVDEVALSNEIERLIDADRRIVRDEMIDYHYPDGKYNISASKLEDLLIEENGRPIRSIIVTRWRSGSTFFSEILGSHPGNYLHYEPFADLGMGRIRDRELTEKAIARIRTLLNCDYADLEDGFFEFMRKRPVLINRSTYLWERCDTNSSICYDHRYLSSLCKLFPFQAMKLTHLRLHAAGELLADEKLAVRLVLLVRDPRGILQSGKHFWLCPDNPDCSEPALICADLVSDYKIAVKLRKKYPTTFRVIRYEDLAADAYKEVEELSKFYGRDFHPNVRRYLDTHTTTPSGGRFSTFRNTKTTPYHWRAELDFEEVKEIQQTCAVAMKYWGYLPAMNATHQREFNPVTDYDIDE